MKTLSIRWIAAGVVATLAALVLIPGCSGTSGAAGGDNAGSTVTMKPAAEPGATKTPDFPRGKFTVQLGAYTSEEGAMKVATLARTRFTREVNTVYDTADALFKVMLGIFDTKDAARAFRDTIVRQYPDEYKDAWVSDLAK